MSQDIVGSVQRGWLWHDTMILLSFLVAWSSGCSDQYGTVPETLPRLTQLKAILHLVTVNT